MVKKLKQVQDFGGIAWELTELTLLRVEKVT